MGPGHTVRQCMCKQCTGCVETVPQAISKVFPGVGLLVIQFRNQSAAPF